MAQQLPHRDHPFLLKVVELSAAVSLEPEGQRYTERPVRRDVGATDLLQGLPLEARVELVVLFLDGVLNLVRGLSVLA